MVVDALLMCFCEDSSINDGSPGREYFMSTSLKVCVGFDRPFGFGIFLVQLMFAFIGQAYFFTWKGSFVQYVRSQNIWLFILFSVVNIKSYFIFC